MTAISAYPLTWPDTMPRTRSPGGSQFKTSLSAALANVEGSLRRFSADTGKALRSVVISSNVTLGQQRPADPGVAVWFTWDEMQVCIAVDRYQKVEHNLQAIHHIIEARRTEMRHGGLAIVRATFRGFQALPAPEKSSWVSDLGLQAAPKDLDALKAAYHAAAKTAHPDNGGSNEKMQKVNAAYAEGRAAMGAS